MAKEILVLCETNQRKQRNSPILLYVGTSASYSEGKENQTRNNNNSTRTALTQYYYKTVQDYTIKSKWVLPKEFICVLGPVSLSADGGSGTVSPKINSFQA